METAAMESGVQLFSRVNQRCGLDGISPKIFKDGGPYPNQAIEVVGQFSHEILVDILVSCICPTQLCNTWKNLGAILINTEHHISMLKIINIVDANLKKLNVKSRKSVIERVLSNLTVINCFDKGQFDITIHSLEEIVLVRDNVNLIAIDNLSAHYWIEKQNNSKLSLDFYTKQRFQVLHDIIRSLNLVLLFSRSQVTDFRKSLAPQVDWKIISNPSKEKTLEAVVINYVKAHEATIQFEIKACLEFR